MNFLNLALDRASIRQYSDREVTADDLMYVLESVRCAPSACNRQPWRFIVVESEEKRALVRRSYDREWFAAAPLYIVCVVRHDEEWVRPSDGKAHGNIDIAIATEHLCLAAAERGLGTCWVCNFDAAGLHSALELAENEEAAVIVPIGYPAGDGAARPKMRKALEEIVSWV